MAPRTTAKQLGARVRAAPDWPAFPIAAGTGYSSPEKRSQAAWRVMPMAAPILAYVMPRARALLTNSAS
jgi:hypothetical protein